METLNYEKWLIKMSGVDELLEDNELLRKQYLTHITEELQVKINVQELYDIYAIDFAKYIIDNDLFFSLKYGRIEYINLIEMFKKENKI